MKKDDLVFRIVLGLTFVFVITIMVLIYREVKDSNRTLESEDGGFGVSFIKQSNLDIGHNNYMISPYSVEIALSMLRDGTGNTTLDEVNKIVPEREIKSLYIENKLNVANGLFIKNDRKQFINKEFVNKLKNNYQAEVIYDEYTTPVKINDWVKKETNGMIPKILNSISPNFVLGIGNAVAMEEDWKYPFLCENTNKSKFTKIDNKKIDVAMMNKSFDEGIYYFEDNGNRGIVLPYKNYSYDGVEIDEGGEQLEFIGILTDDIDSYINDLSLEKISNIDNIKRRASDNYIINVSLPRFEFDYKFEKFKESLINMELVKLFGDEPDFSRMIHDDSLVIDEAIHQTYVKVNEKGTKAAAVTYFGTKNAAIMDVESVDVHFDKPFIFIIKDTTSNELLFFGVVYEPELWTGKGCE